MSIATLTGENGILTQAQNAKEETEKASEKEQRDLAQVVASLNTSTVPEERQDKDGKTYYLPSGFAETGIEGENTVEDGLVIIDEKGNEFVWIPCSEAEYETATDQKGIWEQWEYSNKTWDDTTISDTISYLDRLESIKKYNGFYVARYEAGIPEEMTDIYANTDNAQYNTNRDVTDYTPVSKKGVQAWNLITQTNSKIVAKKIASNNTAQSYLIDSYAWDIICKKIHTKYGTEKNIRDCSTWGNYYNNTTTKYENINTLFAIHTYTDKWTYATNYKKGPITDVPKGIGDNRLELATGASEDFKAYNIYDMAGNMWEWTTEQSTDNCAVRRGGSFYVPGHNIVFRDGAVGGSWNYVYVGFRAVIYLK